MGMTPLEGLVMGTRSGDLDPGAFGFLRRQLGLSLADIEAALYGDSGLKGLAGSSDLRELEARAERGDEEARLAIEIYAYRARKYVGAYAAALGGLDAVVFTGGIGENSASMRARIVEGLGFMGITIDGERNQNAVRSDAPSVRIDGNKAALSILMIRTAEEWMIARDVAEVLSR